MIRTLTLLPLGVLLAGCAQVKDITGGEKDEQPPVLIDAYPAQFSTRFTGHTIVLGFNERITLDRVRDRLLVSPPLDAAPDVRVTGARKVSISLNAPLKPNTTYTFGIGEAVKDLTEGNAAAGLVYVISTGDALDSLLVAGSVTNAFTEQPEKGVLVMLYDASDTVTIRTGRPTYATRTNDQGSFLLAHLREGRYRLHALRDQNANYLYDLPNEEVAFADGILDLVAGDSTVTMNTLRLFQEISPVQAVREARVTADGALRLVLARAAQRVDVHDVARIGGRLEWDAEWTTARDTVHLWPSDTTALQLGRFAVTADGMVLDTIRYRPLERMPFFTSVRATVREEAIGAHVVLRASRPIEAVDESRIRVVRDSIAQPFALMRDTSDSRTLILATELASGASATLELLPKAIRDRYAGHNDTLVVGIGRVAEQSTGNLRVRLAFEGPIDGPLILQLLDGQQRVVREAQLSGHDRTAEFQRLAPGNHQLRLIQDINNNGRWDTGRLDEGLQPEPVWRHPEVVNVRAAWDLSIDWMLP